MTLVRLIPNRNRGLVPFRGDFDSVFDGFFGNRPFYSSPTLESLMAPPVDVEETAEAYIFRADLPGMTEKDVRVSLEGDTLTLRGERKREAEKTSGDVHRTERVFGVFERSFTLPAPVRGEQVKASYRNGVLEIRVPKAEEARAREIEVHVG
ncbi:MAG: Hsp20/alpha crystallin family protein [Candidatus Eisenbacteria bacterium]|nr:Hsp20/alpha crystallin family protein [Candidatus Eisenbacteria bacterium]